MRWAWTDPGFGDRWRLRPALRVAGRPGGRFKHLNCAHGPVTMHALSGWCNTLSEGKQTAERDHHRLQRVRMTDPKRATGTSISRCFPSSCCMVHVRWSHAWQAATPCRRFRRFVSCKHVGNTASFALLLRPITVQLVVSRDTNTTSARLCVVLIGVPSMASWVYPALPTSVLHRPMQWGWIDALLPAVDPPGGRRASRDIHRPIGICRPRDTPSLDPTVHPPFRHVDVPRTRALRSRSCTRSRFVSRSFSNLHRDLGGGRPWPFVLWHFATSARVRHAPTRAAAHVCFERTVGGLWKRARAMADNHGGAREVARPRPFPFEGYPPGPRCGHTLTTLAGSTSADATLVLFGAWDETMRCGDGRSERMELRTVSTRETNVDETDPPTLETKHVEGQRRRSYNVCFEC